MGILKRLKKGVIYTSALIGIYFFAKAQTDGFSEAKIYIEKSPTAQWKDSSPLPTPALEQPYIYLSRGAQSFALASEDGQHVIKFFREDRASHPLKILGPLLPPFAKARLKQTLDKRKKRRIKAFKSYEIALHHLQGETGLLELHLTPSNSQQSLTFRDKIGVVHHLPLGNVPFILQRRIDPFYPTLSGWISQGKIDRARTSLSELVKLLKSRCQKGIHDKDPNLRTNFGWIDASPIQIDVGRFTCDAMRSNPHVYRDDLIHITDPLCQWLDLRAPALASALRREVQQL